MTIGRPEIVVGQMGARMHYAVPSIFYRAGLLNHLYTDICAVKGWPRLLRVIPSRWQPPSIKRLTGRMPEGIPPRRITAFTSFGCEYARRRGLAKNAQAREGVHLWAGRTFCNLVLKAGVDKAGGLYVFNSAALEVLQYAQQNGLYGIVEQTVAPTEIINRMIREESEAFPGWMIAQDINHSPDEFVAREHAEWDCADTILCGSPFVRDGIAACGGPANRCTVVPYGVDAHFAVPDRPANAGPLRVLTVGAIGLRKGTPYVVKVAKELKGIAQFRMVGPITVPPAIEGRIRTFVELTGPVPRSEIGTHYAWADVFLLPSVCEGSATVTYEALAAGLPVICTPNTGSVVRDGIDGFIVPIRDPGAIVERLGRFATDRELLYHIGANARANGSWSLGTYAQNLLSYVKSLSLN